MCARVTFHVKEGIDLSELCKAINEQTLTKNKAPEEVQSLIPKYSMQQNENKVTFSTSFKKPENMKSGQSMLDFFKNGPGADMAGAESDEQTEQKKQIMNQITDGVEGASMNASVDVRLGFNFADVLAEDA